LIGGQSPRENQQLSLRLRVFLDWIGRIFGEAKL